MEPENRTKRQSGLVIGFMLTALVALVVTSEATAADLVNRRLSGTLPEDGYVRDFELSADGVWAVFTAVIDSNYTEAIFSTPVDGSNQPQQLNDPLPAGEYFEFFAISGDSSRVVYLTSRGYTDVQLYSVPIDGGGSPVPLTPPLESWAVTDSFVISPDSSRVIYRGEQDRDNALELYSVPIDGSDPAIRLNAPLMSGQSASLPEISPNSSRVVYFAPQDTAGVNELYAVPLDGSSPPVKLNGPLVSGGNVTSFAISPDSSRVVYRADQGVDEVFELASVPLDGSSAAIRLNGPLVSGGDVNFAYAISPDSKRVVYRADQQTDEVLELYSVRLTGGGLVKLNGPLVSGGYISSDFQFSSDGARLVYLADQDTDEIYELYSVRLNGSERVRLNGPLVDGDVASYKISPDGSQIVYCADEDSDDQYELYRAPLDGSDLPVKLNGPLEQDRDVLFHFQFSADGGRVVYWADQDTDEVRELYSVSLQDGAAPTRLNEPLPSGSRVDNFAISPNSNHVVYEADQETAGVTELFVTFERAPALSFTGAASTVDEDAGVVAVAVHLSEPFYAGSVQVDYAVTGGTARAAGVDFSLGDGTLTFAPGETSQTIEIEVVDDSEVEADETVVISLSSPANGDLAVPDSFTLTIVDNDVLEPADTYTTYMPLLRQE